MRWSERLKTSVREFAAYPSIFLVLVLEMLLTGILFLAFFFIDSALLASVADPNFMQSPQAMAQALLTPQVIAVGGLMLLVQGALLLGLDSLFKAGAYGMARNAIKKKRTSLKEFWPEAKRLIKPVFGYQLIRYALLLAVSLPFLIVLLGSVGTTFFSDAHIAALAATGAIAAIGAIAVLFLLLWGEPGIVLGKERPLRALRSSLKLIRARPGFSITVALTIVLALFIASLAQNLILLPFDLALSANPTQGLAIARDVVGIASSVLSIAAGIVALFFLFRSHLEIRH